MSSICICVVDVIDECQKNHYQQRLAKIAAKHSRGISFSINWDEPAIVAVGTENLIINLTDSPSCHNCEMLLLPDGWCYNNQTNHLTFRKRIKFLQDITNLLCEAFGKAEFYIGNSGTAPSEFSDAVIPYRFLTQYLIDSVGIEGTEQGRHIIVSSQFDCSVKTD